MRHALKWTTMLLPVLVGSAPCQEVFRVFDGREWAKLLNIEAIEDTDLDGVGDYIIGHNQGGPFTGGYAWIRSGLTGAPVVRPAVGVFNSQLGWDIDGGGDFDGDGYPDFIAGAPAFGDAFVYSGFDGSELASVSSSTLDYGDRVAFLGDIDADGYEDVAVNGVGDEIDVYLGPDATPARTHKGLHSRPDVDALGDVDGDGCDDYVIGWPQYSDGATFSGRVVVFSGKDGSPIHRVWGREYFDHLGKAVAGVGDVDGDGVPDFAAGGPGEITTFFGETLGMVRLYSGATGELLHHVDVPAVGIDDLDLTNFGDRIDGGGDVNGDGSGDLIVGEPNSRTAFSVVSGRTGVILWRRHRPLHPKAGSFGFFQAMLDDLDGDGLAEFAVTEAGAKYVGWPAGRIRIFKGFAGDAEPLCDPVANSTGEAATLSLVGPISVGNDSLHLRVEHGPPGQTARVVYGPAETSVPWGDGTLCVDGGTLGLTWLPESWKLGADGSALRQVHFDQPPLDGGPTAWRPGSTWYVQAVFRDPASPGGRNTTGAWRITFTP